MYEQTEHWSKCKFILLSLQPCDATVVSDFIYLPGSSNFALLNIPFTYIKCNISKTAVNSFFLILPLFSVNYTTMSSITQVRNIGVILDSSLSNLHQNPFTLALKCLKQIFVPPFHLHSLPQPYLSFSFLCCRIHPHLQISLLVMLCFELILVYFNQVTYSFILYNTA